MEPVCKRDRLRNENIELARARSTGSSEVERLRQKNTQVTVFFLFYLSLRMFLGLMMHLGPQQTQDIQRLTMDLARARAEAEAKAGRLTSEVRPICILCVRRPNEDFDCVSSCLTLAVLFRRTCRSW